MIKNTSETYGSIAKLFHWTMAILFISMFIVAYIMTNMEKSDIRISLYNLHKATGILLFFLVVSRLSWRLNNAQVLLPTTIRRIQVIAAHSTIWLLYLCMFFMPLTGFLMSTLGDHPVTFFNLFTIPPLANNKIASAFFAQAHEWLSYFFIAFIILHILGALFHHFFLKDNVLRRMWFI